MSVGESQKMTEDQIRRLKVPGSSESHGNEYVTAMRAAAGKIRESGRGE